MTVSEADDAISTAGIYNVYIIVVLCVYMYRGPSFVSALTT